MKLFTFLAFSIWCLCTVLMYVTILPAMVLLTADEDNKWGDIGLQLVHNLLKDRV